jgi:polysaccharide deacetylase 2 family uncharacterized protein YibQ
MPEDKEVSTPPPAPVDTGAPSWLSILAGFSFVATVLVLAAILAVRFAQDRPVNIEAPSAELGTLIERTLNETFLPASAIAAKRASVRSEKGSRWTYSQFDVTVPTRLDVAGLAALFGDRLRTYNLTITTEFSDDGQTRVMKVWLSHYEVGSVTLKPAPVTHAELTDWRPLSRQVAADARATLEAMGIPPQSTFETTPSTREDTEARWELTRFEVRVESPPAPVDLATAIQSRTLPAGTTARASTTSGSNGVVVSLNGRTVAEVMLIPAGRMPGPLDRVPLNTQPDLNDMLNAILPPASQPPAPLAPVSTAYPSPMLAEGDALLPRDSGEGDGRMELASHPEPPGPRSRRDITKPRVAIVLDDGGYGGEITERVLKLDNRVTLAILPNTPEGADTATRAKALGFETILHMPMQTASPTVKPFPGQLNTDMGREQIAQLTTDALAQIPGISGVNNHTGSQFTASAPSMELFLENIQNSGLYFLDSVTGPDSKAHAVAQAMGIPSGRRDVFLDDIADEGEIRRQWAEMVRIARKTGAALAIGHFRPQTLDVVEKELPKLEATGITLVPASELME